VLATLCGGVLIFGVVTASIFWLALRLDPDGLASLGLRGDGLARAGAAGLLSYVMLIPGVLGLMIFWPFAMRFLELEYAPQDVAVGLLEMSPFELALAVPLAVLVVPFFEEVVFRGFLQPLLVQNLGDRGGVVATSAVFGLLHGPSASLPIFGLSLILGGVMLRTQRLLAPCLIHMLHNGLMVFLLLGSDALRDTLVT
jgi:membrane protease YdiL (CAAX protease family)